MSAEEQRVLQVRAICQVAMGCAEVVAGRGPRGGAHDYEKETYEKRKLRAIRITRSITDQFYFETALQSIIELCIAANEMEDAGKLFRMISVDTIRAALLQSNPALERPI